MSRWSLPVPSQSAKRTLPGLCGCLIFALCLAGPTIARCQDEGQPADNSPKRPVRIKLSDLVPAPTPVRDETATSQPQPSPGNPDIDVPTRLRPAPKRTDPKADEVDLKPLAPPKQQPQDRKPVERKSAPETETPATKAAPPATLDEWLKTTATLDIAAEIPAIETRAASFQAITPGISSRNDVLKQLGDPESQREVGRQQVLRYRIGPFPKVLVQIVDDRLQSVIIQLAKPVTPLEIEKELNLARFTSVVVRTPAGEALGQIYPERGVLFSYEEALEDTNDKDEPLVGQVALEPITAEPFLLRAQQSTSEPAKVLADLQVASRLDPREKRARIWAAETFLTLGRLKDADSVIQALVEIDKESVEGKMLAARLEAARGSLTDAIKSMQELLKSPDLSKSQQMNGRHHLGTFLVARGGPGDDAAAIAQWQTTIRLAAEQISGNARDPLAQRMLVDAHLQIAHVVAAGKWKDQNVVLKKWLQTAQQLAERFAGSTADASDLNWRVQRGILAAYARRQGQLNPGQVVEQARREAERLMQASDDPLWHRQIQWELGIAMTDAAQIARDRRQGDQSLQLANLAKTAFAAGRPLRDGSLQHNEPVARVLFIGGVVHAVDRTEHEPAVLHYDQAISLLRPWLNQVHGKDGGRLGDWLISMGVSYWRTGRKTDAVKITQQGIELLSQAVDQKSIRADLLLIPLGNLRTMHRALGQTAEADEVGERLSRLQTAAKDATKKRR